MYESYWRVNFLTAATVLSAVMPAVVAARGSIVLTSSVNAGSGIGECGYSCAKGALHPLVMDTAVAYGKQGVNCNAVALGTIATNVWSHPDMAGILPKIAHKIPRGQVATPEEAASALCWLASPDARLINGQVIEADGGWGIANGTVSEDPQKDWWD